MRERGNERPNYHLTVSIIINVSCPIRTRVPRLVSVCTKADELGKSLNKFLLVILMGSADYGIDFVLIGLF